MRAELKVYLSHTDMARIQEAARISHMSVSAWIRMVALGAADAMGVRRYPSLMDILKGQGELPLEKIGAE